MIEMPRRSVTRFFIPLVDVMMLLLSMYLLLPILQGGSGAKALSPEELKKENAQLDKQLNEAKETLSTARKQINDLWAEVVFLRAYVDPQKDLEKLQKQIAELKKAKTDIFKESLYVKLLAVEPSKGSPTQGTLVFYEPGLDAKPVTLDSEQTALELIEKHQREANIQGKELFYLLVIPTGSIGPAQAAQYDRWFKNVLTQVVVTPR